MVSELPPNYYWLKKPNFQLLTRYNNPKVGEIKKLYLGDANHHPTIKLPGKKSVKPLTPTVLQFYFLITSRVRVTFVGCTVAMHNTPHPDS